MATPCVLGRFLTEGSDLAVLKADILQNLKIIFASKSHQILGENDPLNSKNPPQNGVLNLKNLPAQVASSVINMGLSDFSGEAINDETIAAFKSQLIAQIIAFEPRIDPASITTRALSSDAKYIYRVQVAAATERAGEIVLDFAFDLSTSSCQVGFSKEMR